jgi:hypothetical protein
LDKEEPSDTSVTDAAIPNVFVGLGVGHSVDLLSDDFSSVIFFGTAPPKEGLASDRGILDPDRVQLENGRKPQLGCLKLVGPQYLFYNETFLVEVGLGRPSDLHSFLDPPM